MEEVGGFPVGQLAHEQLGPAGHRHLRCFEGRASGQCDYLPGIINRGTSSVEAPPFVEAFELMLASVLEHEP